MYRAMTLLLATVSTVVLAQQVTITPNYKEADIRQIVEAVGAVTDKNFIIDPRVNAKVTMLSSTPMTPDAFYEAFLSILEVHQRRCRRRGRHRYPGHPGPERRCSPARADT
jgi:general secretion pathway protein D